MGGLGSGRPRGPRNADGLTDLQARALEAMASGVTLKTFAYREGINADSLRSLMSSAYKEHGVRNAFGLLAKLRKAP